MNLEHFNLWLLQYGADIDRWPDEIRDAARQALATRPDCRSVHAEHVAFEEVLRSRRYEQPSPDLAERIVRASAGMEPERPQRLWAFVSACFADVRLPQPIVTTLVVLIVGMVCGLLIPAALDRDESRPTDLQELLYAASEVP